MGLVVNQVLVAEPVCGGRPRSGVTSSNSTPPPAPARRGARTGVRCAAPNRRVWDPIGGGPPVARRERGRPLRARARARRRGGARKHTAATGRGARPGAQPWSRSSAKYAARAASWPSSQAPQRTPRGVFELRPPPHGPRSASGARARPPAGLARASIVTSRDTTTATAGLVVRRRQQPGVRWRRLRSRRECGDGRVESDAGPRRGPLDSHFVEEPVSSRAPDSGL